MIKCPCSEDREHSYLVKQNTNHLINLCYYVYYHIKEGIDIITHTMWCVAKTGVIYCIVLRQLARTN